MLDVDKFLNDYETKNLLRFITCGSVDDGKSTLMGRLLFDAHLIFDDTQKSLEKDSEKYGTTGKSQIDCALLLDGLKAEREQGITIDVAYRYFATRWRKFIIADCPGHIQYTRNMVTGASTADLAVILVDATKGLTEQTRRHAFIVSLLRIPNVIVAINKMDLQNYAEDVFLSIKNVFETFAQNLNIPNLYFIPVCALKGDNVAKRSHAMPFYTGPSLLELLETVGLSNTHNLNDFRFNVHYVIRPHLNFRGFAGNIASGVIKPNDTVCILPSGVQTRIKQIVTADGDLDVAFAPQTVTLTLQDEVDVSAGNLIVHANNIPVQADSFMAHLVWMSSTPMATEKIYLLRHGSKFVKAMVQKINYQVNMQTMQQEPADTLNLNGIAQVIIKTTHPIFTDTYQQNKAMGCFILIDKLSNETVGAGMIIQP